jgi:MOSC domain-containing protein
MTDTGVVEALWRFPVKSMAGEELDVVDVAQGGLVGDRSYALVDAETGKVASAKHPKLWPNLLRCRARFLEPPQPGTAPPPVRLSLADGTTVTSDAPDVDEVLSRYFRRPVTLASSAPDDFTIDQFHPDLAGLDPDEHRNVVTATQLGSAFFGAAGLPSAVPAGAFFDLFPVSVLTTSTLDHLGALAPASRFDLRRFRMNIIVRSDGDGFVENGWLGRTVRLGGELELAVFLPDPRCVMTTLEQDDLPRDTEVLRTLVQHNRLDVAGAGRFPCAGVYAVVTSPGTLRAGDPVEVV